MDEVEQIKSKIDIVDFIGGYLTLKKAGSNYKANCPFHSENTPSFMVSPEKQIYKCFGCNAGGDVFNFLMQMENLEFPEALEVLADKTGVELPRRKNKEVYRAEKNKKNRLYQINNLSAKVFAKILHEHQSGKIALDYLQNRSINTETIKLYQLGFAPQKKVLKQFLTDKGFSEREVVEAGSPDKFFLRIMFPICDTWGNVVGFTGRVVNKGIEPKYLNSPETAIFYKSKVLYGLNLAKQYIKEKNNAVLVEGQMDVISSFQAGVKNVVASSGTALTEDHINILSRYTPNIVFAFDSDSAGKIATKKAITMAVLKNINTNVVVLPEGFKDAGDVIQKDKNLWKKLVDSAIQGIDWYFNESFLNKDISKSQDKKEIAKSILPLIKIIPDKIEQEHYIKLFANKINAKEKIIYEALNRIENKTNTVQVNTEQQKNKLTPGMNLLGLILTYPKYLDKVITKIDYKDFNEQELCQKIYKFLESCYTKVNCKSGNSRNCLSRTGIMQCLEKKLSYEEIKEVKFLILSIENNNQKVEEQAILNDINQSLERVVKIKKDNIKSDFAQKIASAEKNKDRKEVKKLLEELQNAIKEKNK